MSETPLTPRSALDSLIFTLGATSDRKLAPGQVVARSNERTRQALESLTSADVANVRDDVARWFISKPGFCAHGYRFTEQCSGCKRHW